MESLLRLALIAGTGASIGGLQRAGRRVAVWVGLALAIGLISAGAIGYFAAAGWYALVPEFGPVRSSLLVGVALALLAVLIGLMALYRRRRVRLRRPGLMDGGAIGGLPQLPDIDLPRLLERNAGTVMLAAFAVGMFLNRRR